MHVTGSDRRRQQQSPKAISLSVSGNFGVRNGPVRSTVKAIGLVTDGVEKEMNLSIAIAGLLILALVLFFVRRKTQAPDKRPAAKKPATAGATEAFHAVSIKYASSACSAAKSLEGKRFLSTAAPRIPLPDCDVLECKCRFVHHKDRRQSEDRRNPYVPSMGGGTGQHRQEQRQQPDRRKNSDPV